MSTLLIVISLKVPYRCPSSSLVLPYLLRTVKSRISCHKQSISDPTFPQWYDDPLVALLSEPAPFDLSVLQRQRREESCWFLIRRVAYTKLKTSVDIIAISLKLAVVQYLFDHQFIALVFMKQFSEQIFLQNLANYIFGGGAGRPWQKVEMNW